MLKLRTTTEFQVPDGRGVKNVIIRMITSHISLMDINNIKVEGYYYYINENDEIIKLSDFGANSMKLWDDIDNIENMVGSPLSNFSSNRNLKTVFLQRLHELTILQLHAEENTNYGTLCEDWIIDND